MQSIPTVQSAKAPAAVEYVQPGASQSGPPNGVSFESVMAANVQNLHDRQPGPPQGEAPTEGMSPFSLVAALRRRAAILDEELPEELPEELAYILAGSLAPQMTADMDTPQTDGIQRDADVAPILQGKSFQASATDLAGAQAEIPLESQAATFREMMARMPQPTHSETASAASAAMDGGPYPLENVNDTAGQGVNALLGEAQTTPRAPEAALAQSGSNTEEQEPDPSEGLFANTGRSLDIGALRAEGQLQIQQTAAEAPQVTATRETLLDTMVETMSLEHLNGAHSLEIQLRPDYMGKVSIQLTLDEHGLQAKIRTEDPAVRSLIGSQVNQLIESLEQKGIRMNAVDVTYQAPGSQDFSQSSRGREQMNQEDRNRGLPARGIGKASGSERPDALTMDTYVASAQAEGYTAAYSL